MNKDLIAGLVKLYVDSVFVIKKYLNQNTTWSTLYLLAKILSN